MQPLKKDVKTCAYCGPTAIGVITGKPISKIIETIRMVRGDDPNTRKKPVRGLPIWETRSTLRHLGWFSKPVISDIKGQTLAKFLRSRPKELMNVHLLILVTGHWVVVKGRKFADSLTNGEPVFISKAPGRRKRVVRAWVVEKVA